MTMVAADPSTLDWITGISTACAVIVALGVSVRAELRERRGRPVLSLRFDPERGDDLLTAEGIATNVSHCVRFRVFNAWGRRSAVDVEVLVVDVGRHGGSLRRPLGTRPLAWSNSTSHDGLAPRTAVTIPPGVARHIDLLVLTGIGPPDRYGDEGLPVSGESDAMCELQVSPPPRDLANRIDRGTTSIVLAVSARDTDAVYYKVSVGFDGKWWSAKKLREHFEITGPVVAGYGREDPDEGLERFLKAHLTGRERVLWRTRRALRARSAGRRRDREGPIRDG